MADSRADVLRTKRDVARAYLRTGSAAVVLPTLAGAVVARLLLGRWGVADVAVVVAIVLLTGPVEWVVHRHLLHAPVDAWTSRRLGTGSGHREHHLDPPELRWLLLPALDAAIFLVALGLFAVAWSTPIALVAGGPVLPPVATALTLTVAGLAHYEWTHLLAHTAYRPRSRPYARLARHHRRHHFRNERYWLGVTSNLGDRLLRTLPRDGERVPLSDTARTLGG